MKVTNIDFLNIGNGCNLNCSACWYETEEDILKLTAEDELQLMERITKQNPTSSFFAYPKEVTTSPYLIPFFEMLGQKSVLTNGIFLDTIIVQLLEAGIETVKVTLFSSQGEQAVFNNNEGKQYGRIVKNIGLTVKSGLRVQVGTVLDKKTALSIPDLAKLCSDIGVSQIMFYRYLPFSGRREGLSDRILHVEDMQRIVMMIEEAKQKYSLRFSMSMTFGPNFYGKSLEEAVSKISKAKQTWVKSDYLCPAIDGQYRGISLKSGNIYWCFFLLSNPKIAKIGKLNGTEMEIDTLTDLSSCTLMKKLRGMCSEDNCYYQKICLGGCRAAAATMAQLRGEEESLYAGMDICMTRVYENMFKV